MGCEFLLFSILPLDHLSDVPACVVLAGIVGLPLRKVELLAVEAHQPFIEADRTVCVVGDQDFQMVGQVEGCAVEWLRM